MNKKGDKKMKKKNKRVEEMKKVLEACGEEMSIDEEMKMKGYLNNIVMLIKDIVKGIRTYKSLKYIEKMQLITIIICIGVVVLACVIGFLDGLAQL